MANSQIHAVAAGQEDGINSHVNRGTIHIDGCAQRQHKGGNLLTGAQVHGTFLIDGQGSHTGGGGERKDHCGDHALEELEGAHAAHRLNGDGIGDNGVQDVSQIRNTQYLCQIAQNFRALVGNDPGHHAEYADGRDLDDEHHHLHEHFVQALEQLGRCPALFSGKDDPGADEQRNDNDLQHRGVGEGCHDITGEDIDEGGHKVGAGRFIPCAQPLGGKLREPALKDVGKHQADDKRHNGGADIIDQRFPADGADLLDVLHADHAAHHREQHNGHYNELEQIDKDGTNGLDELGGKGRAAGYIYQRPADARTDDEC